MKILLITYFYPPAVSPRAFRWSALAEYWAAAGHQVDVVCAPLGRPRGTSIEAGVRVHSTGSGLRGRLRPESASPVAAGASNPEVSRIPDLARRAAKRLHDFTWKKVYWPDYTCLWYFPATRTVSSLLRRTSYDVVISSSVPFTSHLIGRKAKAWTEVTWLMDIGDPFSFMDQTPTNNHALYRRLNAGVERSLFGRADAVTVTTELTAARYREMFPESSAKVRVIPPLVSLSLEVGQPDRDSRASGTQRLVFLGSLYRRIRNPRPALDLVRELVALPGGDSVELHFYGEINDCDSVFREYRRHLGEHLVVHGVVPRAEVASVLHSADVLVNLGNSTPYQLPSKVIEYAATGKPILNFVAGDTDSSAVFFADYSAALNLSSSDGGRSPADVLQFIKNPPPVDPAELRELLSRYRTQSIAGKYEELFGCES